jgi:hypothetical protein
MLSFKKSKIPISIVKGGQFDDEILYYHDGVDQSKKVDQKPSVHLFGDLFMQDRRNLTPEQINDIYEALDGGVSIGDLALMPYYEKGKKYAEAKSTKEVILADGHFIPIPKTDPRQREAILITGPSGVGKSTYMASYMKQYHIDNPKNGVFFFSGKSADPTIDKLKFVERIALDDDFVEGDPLTVEDLANSLCCFDDIEGIQDPEVKRKIYALKNDLLVTGRSYGIYMCITAHLARANAQTRVDNNECTSVVIFRGSTSYHSKRYLRDYIGLEPKKIDQIMNEPSRWCMISKFPAYVLTENKCYLL